MTMTQATPSSTYVSAETPSTQTTMRGSSRMPVARCVVRDAEVGLVFPCDSALSTCPPLHLFAHTAAQCVPFSRHHAARLQACRRPRQCGHACSSQCHAGPCGACPQSVAAACYCGKLRTMKRCGHHEFSCGQQCGRELGACGHRCKDTCHAGECAPCTQQGPCECVCVCGYVGVWVLCLWGYVLVPVRWWSVCAVCCTARCAAARDVLTAVVAHDTNGR